MNLLFQDMSKNLWNACTILFVWQKSIIKHGVLPLATIIGVCETSNYKNENKDTEK